MQSLVSPLAKAKPRPKPTLTVFPVSLPYREQKWKDVDHENSVKFVLKCQNS